ncbi:hypothetical protein NE237_029430 [Protea cynaroides]|uniref:EF-hand domain-containing protein n=1 Tax=Protea cynaroides TaxID=273540 RepID=A0A9Q0GTW1_9MAGN|nr:hypothetical protein NE237_029430 [Protea cynaroides]
MLQLLSFVFLAVVFICSLINPIFSVPPEKFLAWIRSLLLTPTTTTTISSTMSTTTTSTSKKEEKKQDKVELERVFATFDKNGDGFITKQELGESLKNMGLSTTDSEVESMIAGLDANGDGLIDMDEFFELYDSLEKMNRGKHDDMENKEEWDDDMEKDLREAFDVFDGNGDGLITVDELGLVLSSMGLNQRVGIQECREMIRMVDMDGDGMVNFDEFKKMMKKPTTVSS